MNQSDRITQEIARINAERERAASDSTRLHINRIIAAQGRVKQAEAALVKLKAEAAEEITSAKADLAAVEFEPVDAADIVG